MIPPARGVQPSGFPIGSVFYRFRFSRFYIGSVFYRVRFSLFHIGLVSYRFRFSYHGGVGAMMILIMKRRVGYRIGQKLIT